MLLVYGVREFNFFKAIKKIGHYKAMYQLTVDQSGKSHHCTIQKALDANPYTIEAKMIVKKDIQDCIFLFYQTDRNSAFTRTDVVVLPFVNSGFFLDLSNVKGRDLKPRQKP